MIISFDVRCKKLAYCLTDNNLQIVDLNVINLESKSQLDMIDELNEKLDQFKGNITKVIIEKQSSVNFRKCIIANIIACYYMFHFIDVEFINPKKKTNFSNQ